MSKDEFFAFMPLLIYGIAIGEIVMQWRDYLKQDRRYWPHIITGLALLELAFLNFYYLYNDLVSLFESYNMFLLHMTPPLIFLLTVSVYTPEKNQNLKTYFNDKIPTIFSLLAIYFCVKIVERPSIHDLYFYARILAIIICALVAFTRNFKWFWVFVILRTVLFIYSTIYQINALQ